MEQTGAFPPGHSDLPEAVHGTGINSVANGHHAPELFKPAKPGIWNGNPNGSLPHATVPWWRRYWILVLVLAVVIVGGAIGGGVGGALAVKKEKNDSQLVAPLAGTGTGLGVTTISISNGTLGTISTTSPTTRPATPQATTIISAVTVSIVPTKATTTTTATPTPTPTPAPGTKVYIGQNSQEQLAFFYQDSCQNYVFLTYLGTAACERPFTLSDGVTYTIHGCGGTPWMTWGPGTFLGNCVFESVTMPDCPDEHITGAWICG